MCSHAWREAGMWKKQESELCATEDKAETKAEQWTVFKTPADKEQGFRSSAHHLLLLHSLLSVLRQQEDDYNVLPPLYFSFNAYNKFKIEAKSNILWRKTRNKQKLPRETDFQFI